MTSDQLLDIYKFSIDISNIAALRAVYNAGWYAGAAITPTTTSLERSALEAKPTVIVKTREPR